MMKVTGRPSGQLRVSPLQTLTNSRSEEHTSELQSRQYLHLSLHDALPILNHEFHFGGAWIPHDEGDRPAVGPIAGFALADLDQLSQRDRLQCVSFVGNNRQVFCARAAG